jgi:hypothetical protein
VPQVVNVVTPPATEPVTLAEAKLHLRVDFSEDDALISGLITAARRLCEVTAKITCIATTFDVIEDAFPANSGFVGRLLRGNPASFQGGMYSSPPYAFMPQNVGTITLPRAPLLSVVSIRYLDVSGALQTLSPSVYSAVAGSPGRVAPAFGQVWPVTLPQIGAVTYRLTAGYGPDATTTPENVKAAIKLTLGSWYWNREAVSQDGSFATLPMGVEHLLGIETYGGYQ